MSLRPRAVIVHRRSELDELLDRHNTRGQADFFLRSRGRSLDRVDQAHADLQRARGMIVAHIPSDWAVAEVERADLSRFIFAPEDLVVVVGQDGLVANVAKYLDGQPVLGVNPRPAEIDGHLVRFSVQAAERVLAQMVGGGQPMTVALTMVQASLDDGQTLLALNEIYLGHQTHQSARYLLSTADASEQQSSSGIIISTGAGATAWAASLVHDRGGRTLPNPQERRLAWFVREAWPSKTTQVSLTEGFLADGQELRIVVRSEKLVAFGDGIEDDRLSAGWGQEVAIGLASRSLRLITLPTRGGRR